MLQGVDSRLETLDLGPLAVAVALELADELGERRRDQPQHRAPGSRHQRPAGPRRADGAGSPMRRRRQGRIRAVAGQAQSSSVGGVAQYAPRPSTTGIVRARMVRSSQIDHVST